MVATLPENSHTKMFFRTISYTLNSFYNLFKFFAHFIEILRPKPIIIEWPVARMRQYNGRLTAPISVRHTLLISISFPARILTL